MQISVIPGVPTAEDIINASEELTVDSEELVVEIEEPSADIEAEIIEEDLWVKPGDVVHGFEGANDAIGTLVLRFDTAEDLEKAISDINNWLKVCVK